MFSWQFIYRSLAGGREERRLHVTAYLIIITCSNDLVIRTVIITEINSRNEKALVEEGSEPLTSPRRE
jgi:hypothetical protein